MLKNYSFFTIFLFVLLIIPLSAQEVNVTGEWELTITSQRGERTQTAKFEQDGENITVTMQGRRGGEMTGEGTIKGNEIEWTITRSTQRGEFTITYTGKVSGDTMEGEVQMGDFGSFEWKASRK